MSGVAVPAVPLDHEQVVVRRGPRSGLDMVVAVHSTRLGPALGGARIWQYRSADDGMRDALRLSRAMTLKAAVAGLELGGGKGVVCACDETPRGDARRAVLLDFAELVDSLGGRYVTAEDVGTTARDLMTIRELTPHVVGLPASAGGAGDPSPYTARGVQVAMRACARHRFGDPSLAGLAVTVIGLGNVGGRLARRLARAGASLAVSDIDRRKRALAEELGATWVDPDAAVQRPCDVIAPCALGSAVNRENVDALACEIVCGAANNQLADDELAGELARREILYAPDFVANAGGLITVFGELRGYGPEEALRLTEGIEGTMDRILGEAERRALTPLEAARSLAAERLGHARRPPAMATAA